MLDAKIETRIRQLTDIKDTIAEKAQRYFHDGKRDAFDRNMVEYDKYSFAISELEALGRCLNCSKKIEENK